MANKGSTVPEAVASRALTVARKLFYIDVWQGKRSQFVQVSEVTQSGGRTRIYLDMWAVEQFRDKLTDFCEYYARLGPVGVDAGPSDGCLKSAMIVKRNRRYFLDLLENDRGRFLSVIQPGDEDRRIQLAIPAQGLVEVRNALTELLAEVSEEDVTSSTGDQLETPTTTSCLTMGDKELYFDMNNRYHGAIMRLCEIQRRGRHQSSIMIPAEYWGQFRRMLAAVCEEERGRQSSPEAD